MTDKLVEIMEKVEDVYIKDLESAITMEVALDNAIKNETVSSEKTKLINLKGAIINIKQKIITRKQALLDVKKSYVTVLTNARKEGVKQIPQETFDAVKEFLRLNINSACDLYGYIWQVIEQLKKIKKLQESQKRWLEEAEKHRQNYERLMAMIEVLENLPLVGGKDFPMIMIIGVLILVMFLTKPNTVVVPA